MVLGSRSRPFDKETTITRTSKTQRLSQEIMSFGRQFLTKPATKLSPIADRDGRPMVLHISPTQVGPYPTTTMDTGPPQIPGSDAQDGMATEASRVAAWIVKRTVVRKPCKRSARKRGKKCPRKGVRETLVHDLKVGFGKPTLVRGSLTTSGGGPIAHAEVTVLARPAMAGGQYRAAAVVATDNNGRFTYRAPGGESRTLNFYFRGDSRYKHADDQVGLRVQADATIVASRHLIRNGRSVIFHGKLRGRPYPAKGKVLDLQAYYRHNWRTFATPRASKAGRWRFKYRFQATRGSVLYKFRIRVRATSDYPYELGYSRAVRVRVKGR
jgi:hypothetical protein